MIRGRVTESRRVLVPLAIWDGGNWQTLQVVLDTGFNGHLALPEQYVRQLGLTLRTNRRVTPATGRTISVLAGNSWIEWYGHQLEVTTLQAGTEPLLGMALLWGSHIAIDAETDGAVTITPLGG